MVHAVSTRLHSLPMFLLPLLAIGASACRQEPASPNGPESASAGDLAGAAAALVFRGVSVSTGGHSCGVTTSDQAYCWGDNLTGDGSPLGDGTDLPRSRPVAVVGG